MIELFQFFTFSLLTFRFLEKVNPLCLDRVTGGDSWMDRKEEVFIGFIIVLIFLLSYILYIYNI